MFMCINNRAGINSYIVGCKYTLKRDFLKKVVGINSYIVGCKFGVTMLYGVSSLELIVT